MTDRDKTVGVFVEDEGGERVQVGWSTPDNGGVRKINLFDAFKDTSVKNVTFDDAPLPAAPVEDAPDEELAAEPVDAGVAPEDSEPVVEATIEPDEVTEGELEEVPEWLEDEDDDRNVDDDTYGLLNHEENRDDEDSDQS